VLVEALTHSSYATEHALASNERLEFLGDAVVGLAVSDYVVATYPQLNEGQCSVLRSRVVNEASLAAAAKALGLGQLLRVNKGVLKENGLERPSLLADAYEAVTGALYLERGFPAASTFVVATLREAIAEAASATSEMEPKTRLQRWALLQDLPAPAYEVTNGPSTPDATFVATVRVGDVVAHGSGPSKKRAEIEAAQAAWEELHA